MWKELGKNLRNKLCGTGEGTYERNWEEMYGGNCEGIVQNLLRKE